MLKVKSIVVSIIAPTLYLMISQTTFENCRNSIYGIDGDILNGTIWSTWILVTQKFDMQFPMQLNTSFVNYPMGEDLITIFFIGQLIQKLILFFIAIFLGPVCAVSIFIFIGIWLNYVTTFILLNSIKNGKFINECLSLVFALAPSVVMKSSVHPQLAHIWFIPLVTYIILQQRKTTDIRDKSAIKIVAILILALLWDINTLFLLLTHICLLYYSIYLRKTGITKIRILNHIAVFNFLVLAIGIIINKTFLGIRPISEVINFRPELLHLFTPLNNSVVEENIQFLPKYQNSVIGYESVHFSLGLILIFIVLEIIFFIKKNEIGANELNHIRFYNTYISVVFLFLYFFLPISLYLVNIVYEEFQAPFRNLAYLNILITFLLVLLVKVLTKHIKMNISFKTSFIIFLIFNFLITIPREVNKIYFDNPLSIYDYIKSTTPPDSVLALYPIKLAEAKFQIDQLQFERKVVNPTRQLLNHPLSNAIGISDPETFSILRNLGADYIVISTNTNDLTINKYLKDELGDSILFEEVNLVSNSPRVEEISYLIKIPGGPKADYFIEYLDGFDKPVVGTFAGRWIKNSSAKLRIVNFKNVVNNKSSKLINLRFGLNTTENNIAQVTIKQNSQILWSDFVTPTPQQFDVMVKPELEIQIFVKDSCPFQVKCALLDDVFFSSPILN